MKLRALIIAFGLVCVASTAYGQRDYWPVWGSQPRHSSTLEEGVQRGRADLVRSAGMYNVMTSEAAKNWEDARSKYFDNRMKWTKTYFEMRQYNREYRAAARGPRPTSEQLFRIAKSGSPRRMATSELDPLTGQIAWPKELSAGIYAELRDGVDEIFASRAETDGSLDVDAFSDLQKVLDEMQSILNTRVRAKEIAAAEWMDANTFLKQLRHESRHAG